MEQDLYWASSHNRYINTLTRSDIVCLTTAVQPCAGCRLRRPNNFIQSRAVLCDRDSICIWELIKRLHQQNRKIVSSLAFQVILGFNVLIHLDLLILTQWKFISWKLKSDLRGKIQISFQNPADMGCHQGYSTQLFTIQNIKFKTLSKSSNRATFYHIIHIWNPVIFIKETFRV